MTPPNLKATIKHAVARQSTGNLELDRMLGGGLLPGTLTVIVGATGVGKTQLGLSWADAGREEEGARGVLLDLSSRGDPQNHADYAKRLCDWDIQIQPLEKVPKESFFQRDLPYGDSLGIFGYEGKRVLRSQLDVDQWHSWQSQFNQRAPLITEFVYRQLILGKRRFLVDGIEPSGTPEDSLQMDVLEWIYHRMVRQEHDWLARELFRQDYRAREAEVFAHAYDHQEASVVALVTTQETMLEQLIAKPFAEGDINAGANTVLLMGRTLEKGKMERALYVAKHRGSYCDDRIRKFEIKTDGLHFDSVA